MFMFQKRDTLVTCFLLKASSSVLIVPNIIYVEATTLDHASLCSFIDNENDFITSIYNSLSKKLQVLLKLLLLFPQTAS